MKFVWDPVKAASNLRKHRISFEIAARVFADPFAMSDMDRIEDYEQRWQTLGRVSDHLLLVAHTILDDENGEEVIRIISARRADPNERRRYEQNRSP